MRAKQVRAKRPGLKRSKPWCCAGKRDVRRGLPLEHLPDENELAAFIAVADGVADHAFAKHSGELRSKVANLVGMRKQNKVRLGRFNDLLEGNAETVGR